VTIINSDRPLNEDRDAATISFSELKDRGITLSRNQWETRTGAVELFAPESIVADQYVELVERIEKGILLIWDAPQPFTPFANQLATVKLLDNQEVEIITPDDVWLEFTVVEENNLVDLIIVNALLPRDVLQLETTELSGNGDTLSLTVIDNAQQSDLVSSEFFIRYKTTEGVSDNFRRNRNTRTRFEGEIPPELITYQDNQFIIAVGELPIDPVFLAPGTNVEIELIVTRSFQDKTATQQITNRGTISK